MPQPPRRRVRFAPQSESHEAGHDQRQRAPRHSRYLRPLQRLQQPRPLLAGGGLERRQRQARQRSDGQCEEESGPGRRSRHPKQRHEAVEQGMQAPVLPKGQQQRAQAQREQKRGQPMPQSQSQERQEKRQDADVEDEFVVDAVAPIPGVRRLAEEVRHQQGQQIPRWPGEASGEIVTRRSLPGRAQRQLGHREELHRRQGHPDDQHHTRPGQGKQDLTLSPHRGKGVRSPTVPGAEGSVGDQPQRHVDERGGVPRQDRKPDWQPSHDGESPRAPLHGAPAYPQQQRQPGPGGDDPQMAGAYAHEEVAAEGKDGSTEQCPRSRCSL